MAAHAEWKLSGLGNKGTFVYLTISTGISCAIVNNGSFLRGRGFAGEVGLLPVQKSISGGERTTLENFSSGAAIEQKARERFKNPKMTTEQFFRAYDSGDKKALDLMKDVSVSLADGVYSIVSLLDPQYIVFGGGVINHNPYLLELIQDAMETYLKAEQKNVLGGDANEQAER